MTALGEYLKKHKITQTEFARTLGITQATVSRLASGAAYPRLRMAVQIERLTDGAVDVESWVRDDETKDSEAA